MNKWVIIGAVVIGAIVLVTYFSPSNRMSEKVAEEYAEKIIEQETGGAVDLDYSSDSGDITIETQDGSFSSGENVTLPSDFPSDVYVMKGKLLSVMQTNDKGVTLSLETNESPATIKELYKEKLAADGWEITGVMDFGNTASVTGHKDERDASIIISSEENVTTVVITVALAMTPQN